MSGNNETLDPYEQGYRAERSGLTEKDCPYAVGTPEHARWMEGFHEATDDETPE
jgi:ribosome modulation factor